MREEEGWGGGKRDGRRVRSEGGGGEGRREERWQKSKE